MCRHLLCLLLLITASFQLFAQDNKQFILEGYIFSNDSVPMEGVHLINYRNTKIVNTNSNGYFKIGVETGDSLIINHISLERTIIHATETKRTKLNLYIPYRTYEIETITTRDYKRDKENFEANVRKIRRELEIPPIENRGLDSLNVNRYDNEPISPGLDFRWIIDLLKKKRK